METWYNEENIRALKCFKETYKTAHPDSDGFFFDETYQALLNGEVPMIINFPVHCIPFLYKETDEDSEQDIRVARVPGGRSLAGGWELLFVLLGFLFILEAGYIYLYKKGVLDWTSIKD